MNANTQWARKVTSALLLLPSGQKITVRVDWTELLSKGRRRGGASFTSADSDGQKHKSLLVPAKVASLQVVADGSESESTEERILERARTELDAAGVSATVSAGPGRRTEDSRGTRWYRVVAKRT